MTKYSQEEKSASAATTFKMKMKQVTEKNTEE